MRFLLNIHECLEGPVFCGTLWETLTYGNSNYQKCHTNFQNKTIIHFRFWNFKLQNSLEDGGKQCSYSKWTHSQNQREVDDVSYKVGNLHHGMKNPVLKLESPSREEKVCKHPSTCPRNKAEPWPFSPATAQRQVPTSPFSSLYEEREAMRSTGGTWGETILKKTLLGRCWRVSIRNPGKRSI